MTFDLCLDLTVYFWFGLFIFAAATLFLDLFYLWPCLLVGADGRIYIYLLDFVLLSNVNASSFYLKMHDFVFFCSGHKSSLMLQELGDYIQL